MNKILDQLRSIVRRNLANDDESQATMEETHDVNGIGPDVRELKEPREVLEALETMTWAEPNSHGGVQDDEVVPPSRSWGQSWPPGPVKEEEDEQIMEQQPDPVITDAPILASPQGLQGNRDGMGRPLNLLQHLPGTQPLVGT